MNQLTKLFALNQGHGKEAAAAQGIRSLKSAGEDQHNGLVQHVCEKNVSNKMVVYSIYYCIKKDTFEILEITVLPRYSKTLID